MNQKSLDKKKTKKLDWEKVKEQYKDWCFYNKQHLGRMFDSEAFWDFYLKQTLQQQREEIMEWLEDNDYLSNEGRLFKTQFWKLFIRQTK